MTQNIEPSFPGLVRLHEAAKRNRQERFNNLLHHITEDMLISAYRSLNRRALKGVDDKSWLSYGHHLSENISDLCGRLHTNRYKPQPVKRIWIPKENGQQRPISITTLEDKIVQKALVWVLEAIYENDFLGFSYGFRRGRNQHHALDAVTMAITVKKVSWVLDADISKCFDCIDHTWMMKFLQHRISDKRVLRLIERTLKAGVIEADGSKSKTVVGTPQGAVISPLLANIYLHYVLDLWVAQWRRRHARGEVYIVRYADDVVISFQYMDDGKRLQRELEKRLVDFNLRINQQKTQLIEFGRFAESNLRQRGAGKPATFDFLGFTHICARRRSDGGFTVKRISIAKRQRAKLREIKSILKKTYHQPVAQVGKWLKQVVQGYFNYHAIPGNGKALGNFRTDIIRSWVKALRRRSQRGKSTPWWKFQPLIRLFIPENRVLHPYPNQRLRV